MHTEHPPNIMASREPIVTATRSQAIEIELLERQQGNLEKSIHIFSVNILAIFCYFLYVFNLPKILFK